MRRFAALSALILVAAMSRLLPHPWNWTAIGAVALLGGARFEKTWEALLVPLAALFLSDLALGLLAGKTFGFHETLPVVYGAFALTALAARFFQHSIRGWKIALAAFLASLGFFLTTNFAVWAGGGWYTPNLQGLIACYVAGLPFWASQLLGDLFYSAVLFTIWQAAEARFPALSKVSAE